MLIFFFQTAALLVVLLVVFLLVNLFKANGKHKLLCALALLAIIMSITFGVVMGVLKFNQLGHEWRMIDAIKQVNSPIALQESQGEQVVRNIALTDPEFASVRSINGKRPDQVFIFSPVLPSDEYIYSDRKNIRIFLWSKEVFHGKRLVMETNFHAHWVPEEQIDWEQQSLRR